MKLDAENGEHRYCFATLIIFDQQLDISLVLFCIRSIMTKMNDRFIFNDSFTSTYFFFNLKMTNA